MRRLTIAATLTLAVVLLASACSSGNKALDTQRKQALNQRADAFARAERAVPVPRTTNFPIRVQK